MDGVLKDLRFTLRNMARTPGLAIVITVSLGLGIGANTAIFSLIRAVMLRSLPVDRPEQLVLLHWGADVWPGGLNQSGAGGPRGTAWASSSRSMAYPYFKSIADDRSVFSAVFAFAPLGSSRKNITLAARGSGERVDGEMVSGDYFRGLGVTPEMGRLLSPADDQQAARVAVISHGFWTTRFASDPAVVGEAITINNVPFTIVGVARARFSGVQPGRRPDVWIPMIDSPELAPWGFRPADIPSLLTVRDYWWVHVMARLKDGVDVRQAAAALDAPFQAFVRDALPEVDPAHSPHVGLESAAGGLDLVRGDYEQPLSIMMAMVGVVLLIACANVAVLLLARATGRRREFALRLSLGAGRLRLVRQLLTESAVMAVIGGTVGLLLAGWTSRALLFLLPDGQRPLIDGPIDTGVLAFAVAMSAATAILFGVVPAIVGTRVETLPALKQAAGSTVISEHPAYRFWSGIFVVLQIALSLTLLVASGLFIRTITNLQRQSLGVDHQRLLVFGVDASQNGYSGERLANTYGDILRRLERLPGVESASATRLRLFSGWVSNGVITISGEQPKPSGMVMHSNAVGPRFAQTAGLQVRGGRDLTWSDIEGRRRVALVNEAMASYVFGNANPVGRRFAFGDKADPSREYEIVGVVSNARYSQVRGTFPRTAYVPYTVNRAALGELYMMVRASGDPMSVAEAARGAVREVDSTLAIVELDGMTHQVTDSLWQERLMARLTSVFGLVALTLACVGIYGTIAYGVGRRRAEIAVRVALGARDSQIVWMILRRALVMAAIGVLLGTPLTLWAGQYVATLLFELSPRDPLALLVAATTMFVVAASAGYIPARRALAIQPAAALKHE